MYMVTEEFTLVNEAHIKLQPVIWVHAFERYDGYYYRYSKTPQVAKFHKLCINSRINYLINK